MIKSMKFGIGFLLITQLFLACKEHKDGQVELSPLVQQVDSIMEVAFSRELFNGTILIAKNDQIQYQRSFGYSDYTSNQKLNNSAIYNIGSIAKEFNGVALLMLAEQGKLSLDDTLDSFNLELPKWAEKIAVKHLVNYAGGLPKMPNYGAGIKNDSIALAKIRKIDSLLFEPGTEFNYNNYSVFLQRRIIEKVTNQSFEDYVRENLIKPIGMESAVFDPSPDHPQRTSCYDMENQPCPELEFISGWLWMSATDLYQWIRAMNNQRLVSQESFSWALQNPFATGKTSSLGEYFEEEELQRHNGSSWKFRSVMLNDFKNDMTIILLDNREGFALELGHVVHKLLQGKDYELPKKSVYIKLRKVFKENVGKGIAAYQTLAKHEANSYDFENPVGINRLGYEVLRAGNPKAAITTFEFGIAQFPNNANLYDSLGEAYLTNENFEEALLNYKKAIALGGTNGNAKKMVNEIQSNMQR